MFTDYFENLVQNFWRGTAMPSPPANLHFGIWNGDPGELGTGGTEVTTTIRPAGRVAIAPNPTNWNAPATSGNIRGTTNAVIVDFGVAAGAATATHLTIHDAATGGNMIGRIALSTPNPRSIVAGGSVSFPVGSVTIGWDMTSVSTSGLTNFGADQFLNWFRGTNPVVVPTWYLALYNGDPGVTGTGGTELTGTVYTARQALTASSLTAPSQVSDAARTESTAAISFGNALVAGNRTHLAWFDALTAGGMWRRTDTNTPTSFAAGDLLQIPAGSLTSRTF